jgi:pyruvate/2-oxoglutarate dehydrogenase complex dihydrolipoamide acyltransferase (E2) component
MISTWSSPGDPTVYAPLLYDVTKTLQYIKKINEEQKEAKITMTHIFAMAMAWALSRNRRDAGRLYWGNF